LSPSENFIITISVSVFISVFIYLFMNPWPEYDHCQASSGPQPYQGNVVIRPTCLSPLGKEFLRNIWFQKLFQCLLLVDVHKITNYVNTLSLTYMSFFFFQLKQQNGIIKTPIMYI